MPAVIREGNPPANDNLPVSLGPRGPFPNSPLLRELERRWLHYAFLSRDNQLGMVANIAWLGPDEEKRLGGIRNTSILLVHRRGQGWRSSQFNAETLVPLWSAFRLPHPTGQPQAYELSSTSKTPFVKLRMQRSSRPCTSQCAPFAVGQHLRWQSETGVIARGDWGFEDQVYSDVAAVGYHERVRGYWGWPELGGWVFGFVNDPRGNGDAPPTTAIAFTLIQPLAPADAASGSVMLWRQGRLRRHFPRRDIDVATFGQLDRNKVSQVPDLANLFSVPPMAPIPRRLMITAQMGPDWVILDFGCEDAARVVIPSETGIDPFSVHEVIGPCEVEGQLNGEHFAFQTNGIVEFAGGAGGD